MKFELNRKYREEKLLAIFERDEPVSTGIKLPIRHDKTFNVYKVPINILVYNHLNDRFASKRIEYFQENKKELNDNTQESLERIEKFIWESSLPSNKATMSDIAKNGQQKYGVITLDGRIIDGNRRVTLIRKILSSDDSGFPNVDKESFMYFDAIILPGGISDEEMMTLETQIQMGEDEKVEYNAIEKYLKIQKLYNANISYSRISGMIANIKNAKKVKELHEIYGFMEEYLDYIGAPNRFSLISKFEDHFIQIRGMLNSYDRGHYAADWSPSDADITELKHVCFDYIRKGHEGKDFRNLMGGRKGQRGIFSKLEVWSKFKIKHFKVIDNADKELKANFNDSLAKNIAQREEVWKEKVVKGLDSTIKRAKEAVDNFLEIGKPKVLAEGALDKINLIDIETYIENYDEKNDKETYEIIKEINDKTGEIKERIIRDVFKS